MGAGHSAPQPPPRLSKKLPDTTIQLQHLPPVLSADAIQGINVATLAQNGFLAGKVSGTDPGAITSSRATLAGIVRDAQRRGNFRDYLVLLLEDARLGLLTESYSVSPPLLELACLVNPFLQHATVEEEDGLWEGVQFAPSFRSTDLGLVTESERDLLVLLYYLARVGENAEEAVSFVASYIEKHATSPILTQRKESFMETEIFIHWAIFRLVPLVAKQEQQLHLSEAGASKLHGEVSEQIHRFLTLCHTLLAEHRLDQICLLFDTLDVYVSREAQAYIPPSLRSIAKGMKKKRADRATQPWHKATADCLLEDLKSRKKEARETWGRRAGVRVGIGEGHAELERAKAKKD